MRLKAGILTGLNINFSIKSWKQKPIQVSVNEILIILGTSFNYHEELIESKARCAGESESEADYEEEYSENSFSVSESIDTFMYNYYSPGKIKEGKFDKKYGKIL